MKPSIARPIKSAAVLLLVVATLSGTVSRPTPRSTETTPAPNLGIAWHSDVVEASDYVPVGDVVIAVGPRVVTAIDFRTGERRWRSAPPPGFSIVSWEVTDGAVVLVMDDRRDSAEPQSDFRTQTTGLDVSTGRPLWEDDGNRSELLPSDFFFLHGGAPVRMASSGETVVVPTYGESIDWSLDVVGVAARTGEIVWRQVLIEMSVDGFNYCDITAGGDFPGTEAPLLNANDQVVAFAAQCDEGEALIGLDPRHGAARWAAPIRGGTPDRLIIDDDAILVGQARHGTIFDSGGRILFQGGIPPAERMMAVSGDIAAIAGTDSASDPIMGVDLRNGRVLWSHPRTSIESPLALRVGTYSNLAAVNGAILGYRSAAGGRISGPESMVPDEHLLPAAIDRIDPTTGSVVPTAIPVTGSGDLKAARLLLVSSGGGLYAMRLAADGTPAGDNAPAPPQQWPDACALLSKDHLHTLWPNSRPTITKQFAGVLDDAIPKPVQCHFDDPAGGMSLAIRWVAHNPHSAEALATDARKADAGIAFWGRSLAPPLISGPWTTAWAHEDRATWLTFTVGPVIGEVRSWDPTVPAPAVARLVTQSLHDLGFR